MCDVLGRCEARLVDFQALQPVVNGCLQQLRLVPVHARGNRPRLMSSTAVSAGKSCGVSKLTCIGRIGQLSPSTPR